MLSAKEFQAKYATKPELERFLRLECDAYLPDHRYCTVYWYKDLVFGNKKVSQHLLNRKFLHW